MAQELQRVRSLPRQVPRQVRRPPEPQGCSEVPHHPRGAVPSMVRSGSRGIPAACNPEGAERSPAGNPVAGSLEDSPAADNPEAHPVVGNHNREAACNLADIQEDSPAAENNPAGNPVADNQADTAPAALALSRG